MTISIGVCGIETVEDLEAATAELRRALPTWWQTAEVSLGERRLDLHIEYDTDE